jgi:hypothetical protein
LLNFYQSKMAKKYRFDLTVDSSALLQANPVEFYSRLYGMESASGNFRVLPGVKNKTKIANVLFDKLIQEADCAFNPTDATVSAIEVDVCALSVQTSVCQYQLESAWLADQMAKGSNSDFTVASFMAYFWEQMSSKAHEELAKIMWQGDTDSEDPILAKCDGWLKRLCGLDGVIRAAQNTVTSSTVIADFGDVLGLATDEMLASTGKLQFKVAPNVASAYRVATASANTINYTTAALGLQFLDIQIVVEYGLPANTIILTDPNNFVYALDAEGDMDSLQIVDFSKTTLDRTIGARADFKVGFYITNPTQIVLFGDCVAS